MFRKSRIAALEDARKQVVEDTVELLKFFHEIIIQVVMIRSCKSGCFGLLLV
nr:myosin-2-like [Ipomoea batatas]